MMPREREVDFGHIAEQSLFGVMVVQHGRIRYANAAASEVLGYPVEDMLGWQPQEVLNLVHPEDRPFAQEQAQRRATGDRSATARYAYRVVTKSGETKWVEQYARVIEVDGQPATLAMAVDITERKQAEEARQRSELLYRTLVETLPDALFMTDLEGRVTFASSLAAALLGFDSPDELLGRQGTDFVVPERRDGVASRLPGLVASGGAKGKPARLQRKDGSAFPAEANSAVVRDAGGTPQALVVVVRDTTEREQTEAQLRASENKYRLLAENVTDVIWTLDTDLCHTYLSPSARRLLGRDPDELMGRPLDDVFSPDSAKAAREAARKMLLSSAGQQGVETRAELTVERRDGTDVSVEIAASPLLDDAGRLSGIVGVTRDISDRKRAEGALRQSERRYREVAETVPIGILELARDGRITYANEGYCRMTGFDMAELKGGHPWSRSPEPEAVSALFQQLMQEQPGPSPWYGETLHKSGRPLHTRADWSFRRDENDEAIGIVAVISDITEQKRLEEQLRHAQKMEAIGTLAGGVAHDVNNLLTPILGCADMLSQQAARGSHAHELATIIKTAARRCSTLTTQLLGFARKGKLLDTAVDMHRVISDTVTLLGPTIDKRIAISLDLEAGTPVVTGDPAQLEQVIMNLAVNARDAMPEGGQLTFQTGNADFDEDDCRTHAELVPGPYVVLSVDDTGVGMTPEVCERLFEPFFTTKPEGEGTGMGLAMVYGIVKNHGGAITVRSEIGKGTSFKVYLPLGDEVAVAEEPARETFSPDGSGGILVVDDEVEVRRVVQVMLSSLGYSAVLVENGQEAVAYYQDHGPEIDLVILDLTMPVMGGQQCFRELKRLDTDVKVVVATGHALNDVAQTLLDEGALGCVQKPFVKAELSQAIAAALSGNSARARGAV